MNTFHAHKGQFWLNDQPQLIQAGEFHYFRTPPQDWPQRLGLLKRAGFTAVASYIPWLWHQLEEDLSDFSGHSHPLRNLAGFLDLASELGFWIIARPGPYIMAETINEGIPPWVFDHYPRVAIIDQQETLHQLASYMHPDFLACVRNWYQAVFQVLTPRQITRGGKIIMIQLDNEMGMPHWLRNIFDCNPDTILRFASYLNQEKLAQRYPVDNLTDFLQQTLQHPEESSAVRIAEDYRRFYRCYLRDYTSFLWSEAKANGMEVLPVINIHGFGNGGKTFPIGLSQLREVIRLEGIISATDVYPLSIGEGNFHELLLLNEMTKALQHKEQALFSIEFQAGGNQDFSNAQTSLYDLHSRLCISLGMRAINHYLFFDGENDPVLSPVKRHDWGHPVRKDGSLRKHYFRYPRLSQVLTAYGTDLLVASLQTTTSIGFIVDYFMTEVNNSYTQESTNILTRQRELILFDFIARGLALTHRPFTSIELSCGELKASQTPLCWVMLEKQCPADIQQKLLSYLHDGGQLVLIGRICTEDFDHQACTLLKDALGISHSESNAPFDSTMCAFDIQDIPVSFVESYTGIFDEVFARDSNGAVLGFITSVGKGRVMMLGASMSVNSLDDLAVIEHMANKMNCAAMFRSPNWLDIRLSCGDKGSFLFINNYQDDPVETIIDYQHRPLLGGNSIKLAARTGQILPLDWLITEGVRLHYITSEIVEIDRSENSVTLKTAQHDFLAELSLEGYSCQGVLEHPKENQRIAVKGQAGILKLERLTQSPD